MNESELTYYIVSKTNKPAKMAGFAASSPKTFPKGINDRTIGSSDQIQSSDLSFQILRVYSIIPIPLRIVLLKYYIYLSIQFSVRKFNN